MAALDELTASGRSATSTSSSLVAPEALSDPWILPSWATRRPWTAGERAAVRVRLSHSLPTRPAWLSAVISRAAELTALPPGWDSYGAPAISAGVVSEALSTLLEVVSENTPEPWVVPLSSGGLQFEWRRGEQRGEVAFEPGTHGCFSWQTGDQGFEGSLTQDLGRVRDLVSGLG